MLRACLALILLSAAVPAAAQERPLEPFFPGGTYDPGVPTPESVLGYAIGEHHTDYAGLERWLNALRRSDRVVIRTYGESIEKRPLYLIFLSSPANLARLDAIQKGIAQLASPAGLSDADAARLAADLPAVAWMNHANDGNESAAFESAIQTTYQLAAGTDAATRTILDELVTIVNPAHNPESHERFVAWYNAVQVGARGTADRAAAEHHAPWGMNTNNNHYQIDLNRDAFFATQPETRALIRAFNEWNPVVFVDHHGQTKNMFFPPPADAVNLNVTKPQLEWMNRYGNAIGDAFDARGWSYYRRGRFDLFFAGFWDSWPTLNGSIGMTFETDGGGGKGLAWEREDGTILTLRDGVLHHHTGTMATLKATADDKDARLRQFYEFKKTAIAEGRSETMRQIVLMPGDLWRMQELLQTLALQRIEGYYVDQPVRLAHAQRYAGGAAGPLNVPAGAFVIPLAQPQKRLIKALLEIEPAFTDEFLEEQRRKRRDADARGVRVRDGFYDTTAWSLPLIFGIDAYWSSDAPAQTGAPLAAGGVLGSREAPGRARYGYVFEGGTYGSMRALAELIRKGHNAVVATEPFTVGGRQFARGAVLLRSERNGDALHADVREVAKRIHVMGLDSARVTAGPDFGEDPFVEILRPRIAMITDEPTDERSYGAAWFTLEQRLGLPFTAIKIEQLLAADLARYDVIVMPDGSAAAYQSALGEAGVARLRRWTEDGGTLVLIKGAAALGTRKGVEWTSATLKRSEQPVRLFLDEEVETKPDEKTPMRDVDLPRVPGAILRVKIDPQHWLGFGLGAETSATITSNYAFEPGRTGRIAAAYPAAGTVKLAGFMWPESAPALARTPYAWIERTGRGQMIFFADDPNFRAAQLSTLPLFFNAVVIGPSFTR